MVKPSTRAAVAAVVSVPVLAVAGGVAAVAEPPAAVPLAASAAPGLDQASRTGPEDTGKRMPVAVSLNLRDEAELDALLGRVSDPASPEHGRYLTPEQFRDRFSPTQEQADTVVDYLRSQGVTVTGTSANRLAVQAVGSVADLQRAFGTAISRWHDRAEDRDFTANDAAARLPPEVAPLVSGVAGLNDHFPRRHLPAGPGAQRVGSGPNGGYTPAELRGAYGMNPLHAGGIDGSGQTIGLIEFAAFDQSNVTAFDDHYRTGSPAPTVRPVAGGNSDRGDNQVEVELDIEVLHAIAPKANVAVYEAPNNDAGEIAMWSALVADNVPVVSSSWGLCELGRTRAQINAVHALARQATAQGMSVLSASGDSGAYDCERDGAANAKKLAVDYPAADPNVTAVGGTSLSLGPDAGHRAETAWSENGTWATGGGYSSVFDKPRWQLGPGVQSQNQRQTPDVSAAAARGQYSIYSKGRWLTVGGTSASTPLWAASLALYDQKAATLGKPRIGLANPALYRLAASGRGAAAFHDVTSGDNRHYPATAGYDLATGWGSLDASTLVSALLEQ